MSQQMLRPNAHTEENVKQNANTLIIGTSLGSNCDVFMFKKKHICSLVYTYICKRAMSYSSSGRSANCCRQQREVREQCRPLCIMSALAVRRHLHSVPCHQSHPFKPPREFDTPPPHPTQHTHTHSLICQCCLNNVINDLINISIIYFNKSNTA